MPLSRLRISLGTVLLGSLALAGCGGGSTNTNYSGSTVVGQVLMGANSPVNGNGTQNVCAYAVVNGQGNPLITTVLPYTNTGTLLSCVPSGADGSFSMNLTSFYGPVLLQVVGGTYSYKGASQNLNSLTSTALNLAASDANAALATNASLQAMVNVGGGNTVTANITPLTTFAVARITPNSGLTIANYTASLQNIAGLFGLGSLALATAVPASGDAYDKALMGVEQYLATMTPNGSNTDDPYAAHFLNWTNLATVSADYSTAYNTANGTSGVSFNFN
ncbi:hypothetical protein [Thiomonas bhubaneswarensis]|uniref:Lipoprotein n=1 Tax=Thiomonas bhubaneswarensis TaxID=339866 RepID=A0A0K6HSZ9_9BURK|nr:hypothetical protein [Thiomonas bhubaneswarensis]CUA93971.1 hypothetical protein Ga0061069_101451 [Thiomonas bhubaneswarensis]